MTSSQPFLPAHDPERRRLVASLGLGTFMPWSASAAAPSEPAAGDIAVCLSSGGTHGYAHVGAIRAFRKLGLQPQVIAGTSVGAIAGVLWAAGVQTDAIEAMAMDSSWHEASGLRLPRLGLGQLTSLRDLLDRTLGAGGIESLPTRFVAVATDLDSGRPVVLRSGRPGAVVAASASVPIRYEPVELDGLRLVDGALSAPVPVDAARQAGAGFTIAVDVAYRPYEEPVSGITGVAFQMFHIMVNRLIDEQIKRADFAIRLDLHATLRDEGGVAAVIRAGEAAVRKNWPALQAALAARKPKRPA
jgi:NTE family protein